MYQTVCSGGGCCQFGPNSLIVVTSVPELSTTLASLNLGQRVLQSYFVYSTAVELGLIR